MHHHHVYNCPSPAQRPEPAERRKIRAVDDLFKDLESAQTESFTCKARFHGAQAALAWALANGGDIDALKKDVNEASAKLDSATLRLSACQTLIEINFQ